MLLLGGAAMLPPTVRLDFIVMFIVLLYLARPLRQRFALPPLPKGEALAVLIRMLKSVYFFLFLASSSIRAIWSSGVVQVPTG